MKYISTRGCSATKSFSEILTCGTADDGGLYVPRSWPQWSQDRFEAISAGDYTHVVQSVVSLFAGGSFTNSEIEAAIGAAMGAFDTVDGPPLTQIDQRLWSLELFHGPTLAFKDYALVPLAELLERRLEANGANATLLCATSGDTGAATASAVAHRDHMQAVILFPEGRVSPVQRRQMTTLGAGNIVPLCVRGNFDACQALVKGLFQSAAAERLNYTAVNSINMVRIILQVGYYLRAAIQLQSEASLPVNVIVPTGNFGNIFAAYIAKQLGAPIGKLVVATNDNDVLVRLLETGRMMPGKTVKTLAPSMDIQTSSNFERLLWLLKGRDGASVLKAQSALEAGNSYALSTEEMRALSEHISAVRCNETAMLCAMRWMRDRSSKTVCPHTATAVHAALEIQSCTYGPIILAETAHPSKFPDAVAKAGVEMPPMPERLRSVMTAPETFETVDPTIESVQSAIDAALARSPAYA